jgi:hypothetical protein
VTAPISSVAMVNIAKCLEIDAYQTQWVWAISTTHASAGRPIGFGCTEEQCNHCVSLIGKVHRRHRLTPVIHHYCWSSRSLANLAVIVSIPVKIHRLRAPPEMRHLPPA